MGWGGRWKVEGGKERERAFTKNQKKPWQYIITLTPSLSTIPILFHPMADLIFWISEGIFFPSHVKIARTGVVFSFLDYSWTKWLPIKASVCFGLHEKKNVLLDRSTHTCIVHRFDGWGLLCGTKGSLGLDQRNFESQSRKDRANCIWYSMFIFWRYQVIWLS